MHMSGAGVGEAGHGDVPGERPAQGSCNPRKFSEKIALHTQRQAEDTAAFREVMMDITSIRVQAGRVCEDTGIVSYHGGSLPNVNQILRCSVETEYPGYHAQQLGEEDDGYRVLQPSPFGRPHRTHFDNRSYLSTHLSPPRGPAGRSSNRNWSSCSATEKSQMVRLPPTALNRTNSDSALHTSVRNIHPSAQVLNPHTKRSMFANSVPLIEENIQEETSPKIKKLSSVTPSGCETSFVHDFLLPDQQVTSLALPSALSTSGSLPDLSSLHLPSPLPVGQEPEPHNFTPALSCTSTHDIITAFNLPGLSSCLQASFSNPLLQSSLSNPNIQSTLSSQSLPSSLSSTSSRLSLSNSSLPSSLSNQSLRSSLSSSSLGNQSVQSSASHSSGIGGSRSCSSASSLSSSPRVPGHAHSAGSRKRAQLSPLIVSGAGESRWQQSKQFSPTLSPSMCSSNQNALLNPSKVLKEAKPPAYPCSQLLKTGPPVSHQPVRHYFPPEPLHRSLSETDYVSSQQPEHQLTYSQTQQPLLESQQHSHKQIHLQPQMNYHDQPLLYSNTQPFARHQQVFNTPRTQHHRPSKHPAHQQFQDHLLSEEQYQCFSPWRLPCQQVQYQVQHHQPHQQNHGPKPFPSNALEESWAHVTDPRGVKHGPPKRPLRPSKPQSETERKNYFFPKSKDDKGVSSSPSLCDKGFELNKESYAGLHLTPSQAEALSQQLGVLQKEPLGGSRGTDLKSCHKQSQPKYVPPQPNQISASETQNVINSSLSESLSWLDQDITGFSESVLEFDLESFGPDSVTLPSLEDLGYG